MPWLSLIAADGGYFLGEVLGLLIAMASFAMERRIEGTPASVLVRHGLSCAHGMWNFPGPEIEPVSPASQDRFLTTGPPGKGSRLLGATLQKKKLHVYLSQGPNRLSRKHCVFYSNAYLFILMAPQGMWDLSSPTRDRIRAPCSGSLNHWTARDVPALCFLNRKNLFREMVSCMIEEAEKPTGVGERATERPQSEAIDTSGQEGQSTEVMAVGSRRRSITGGLSSRGRGPRGRTFAAGGAALHLQQAEAG